MHLRLHTRTRNTHVQKLGVFEQKCESDVKILQLTQLEIRYYNIDI